MRWQWKKVHDEVEGKSVWTGTAPDGGLSYVWCDDGTETFRAGTPADVRTFATLRSAKAWCKRQRETPCER